MEEESRELRSQVSNVNETLENQKEKEDRLSIIENQMKTLISTLGNIKDQNQVNQMAQTFYSSGVLNTSQKNNDK